MAEKKYKLRKLVGKDIFKISKLLHKIGFRRLQEIFENDKLRDAINAVFTGDTSDMSHLGSVVSSFVCVVVESLGDIEEELPELLESVSNLSREEVDNLPIEDWGEMIKDLITKDQFAVFFKRIFPSFAKEKTQIKTT